MKIESVDFFYLAMPEVTDAADGSQDACLVRVSAGGLTGWGECEAAPLPSIAAFVCPMSHGACRPVGDSVLGRRLDGPADIAAMARDIAFASMDLLQAAHAWSGVEVALWDLLGKARGEPCWRLLGQERSHPKTPYASVLFGATAQETLERGRAMRARGFRAVKFGWAPYGAGVEADRDQVAAAREGIGPDGVLLIDAGQVFGEDVDAAAARMDALAAARATWLEEPFHGLAYDAYGRLAARDGRVRLAGGEAAHDRRMAEQLIDLGGVGFVQIDCGRIGGLGPARAVALRAQAKGVAYVNHTFTSNLALSASLQPYADLEESAICEYPTMLSPLARDLTRTRLVPDADGLIRAPEGPGLGIEIDPATVAAYALDCEIRVGGRTLYATPRIG